MTKMEFEKKMKSGKYAENIFKVVIEDRGNSFIDVSNDKTYQKQDTDFIVLNRNLKQTLVEVKGDLKADGTNNIALEDYHERGKNNYEAGWIHKCKANYICYLVPQRNKFYVLDWSKKDKMISFSKHIRFWNKSDVCYSWLYILDIDKATKKKFVIYDIDVSKSTIKHFLEKQFEETIDWIYDTCKYTKKYA